MKNKEKKEIITDLLCEKIIHIADMYAGKDNLSFDDFIMKYSKIADDFKRKGKLSNFIGGEFTVTDLGEVFNIKIEHFFLDNGNYSSIIKEIQKIPYAIELSSDAREKIKGMFERGELKLPLN